MMGNLIRATKKNTLYKAVQAASRLVVVVVFSFRGLLTFQLNVEIIYHKSLHKHTDGHTIDQCKCQCVPPSTYSRLDPSNILAAIFVQQY